MILLVYPLRHWLVSVAGSSTGLCVESKSLKKTGVGILIILIAVITLYLVVWQPKREPID